MKKLLFTLCISLSLLGFSQAKKDKAFDLEPKMRLGTFVPVEFGNTALNQFYKTPLGLDINFTLFKIYNVEFTGGLSYTQYQFTPQPDFLYYTKSNQTLWYGQLGYAFKLNEKWDITPCFTLGFEKLTHKKNGDRLASQQGVVTRLGGYVDYHLGKVVSVYGGLHFSHTNYTLGESASSYRDLYHTSFATVVTLGFELN